MLKQTTTPFLSIDKNPSLFAQVVVGASGVLFTLTGLALLLAPRWFYDNIGTFPPFNRHYEGDLGSFLLPIGLALLYAARAPQKHRAIIAIAAGGSVLHVINHLFDGVTQSFTPMHWLTDTLPLAIAAALLVAAFRASARKT